MKKKRLNKTAYQLIGICLSLFSIYLLIGVGKEVYSTIELGQKAKTAQEELQKLKDENAELISQKKKLEDPNYVQSYARGNYMFSKEGEQIFYLPKEKE